MPVRKPCRTADPLDYEGMLRRTLVRLQTAVFDPDTPPRDLAALSRRMLESAVNWNGSNPRTAGLWLRPRRR